MSAKGESRPAVSSPGVDTGLDLEGSGHWGQRVRLVAAPEAESGNSQSPWERMQNWVLAQLWPFPHRVALRKSASPVSLMPLGQEMRAVTPLPGC